jgi:hypothetical protein
MGAESVGVKKGCSLSALQAEMIDQAVPLTQLTAEEAQNGSGRSLLEHVQRMRELRDLYPTRIERYFQELLTRLEEIAAAAGLEASRRETQESNALEKKRPSCQIPAEHLGQLEGLPSVWRLMATGAEGNTKRPLSGAWNTSPLHRLTVDQLLAHSGALGAGVHTGRASGGLLVVDFDSPPNDPHAAHRAFERAFGKAAAALPQTVRNESGKEGRYKVFLQVPEEFWGLLPANWEAPKIADPSDLEAKPKAPLEVLWERADGASLNAVICGVHPQSTPEKPLFYRWLPGCSPAEVAVAAAPGWLLQGLVRLRIESLTASLEKQREINEEGEGGSGIKAWEHLNTGQRRKLQLLILRHAPNRQGRGSGTHADVMHVLLGTWRELDGNRDEAVRLLEASGWEDTNQWESGATLDNQMVSITSSTLHTGDGKGAVDFSRVIKLAKEVGNSVHGKLEWPKWALPPRELDLENLATAAAKKVQKLRECLETIDEMSDPVDRLAAYQELTRMVGCRESEMSQLVELMKEQDASNGFISGDHLELLAKAAQIKPCIERLLASGAVTMVASEGGVGKSVLIYRLAEAVANGSKFGGQLQAVQGNVLVVQKDESPTNAAQKLKLMGLSAPSGSIMYQFRFNAAMYPELRRWIAERNVKLVVMDSFGSLFMGAGAGMGEAEVGLHLYRLNQIASDMDCAIVLTHHLRKQDKSKGGARKDVFLSDLFGSSYIVNGASDVWGVVKDPDTTEPKFVLKVLKPRTGITEAGDTFELLGSREDLSLTVSTWNGQEKGVEELRGMNRAVVEALRGRSEETAVEISELAVLVNGHPTAVSRVLKGLMGEDYPGLQRSAAVRSKGAGRPTYRYWIG